MEKSNNNILYILVGSLFTVMVILSVVYFILTNKNTKPGEVGSFPTPNISATPIPAEYEKQTIKIQQKADDDWKAKSMQVDKSYPWLDKLPIQTSDYFVYFDINDEQFHVKIYGSKSQLEEAKKAVQDKLASEEIPYEKYKFEWTVKPK